MVMIESSKITEFIKHPSGACAGKHSFEECRELFLVVLHGYHFPTDVIFILQILHKEVHDHFDPLKWRTLVDYITQIHCQISANGKPEKEYFAKVYDGAKNVFVTPDDIRRFECTYDYYVMHPL
jgi:hypothetical protein